MTGSRSNDPSETPKEVSSTLSVDSRPVENHPSSTKTLNSNGSDKSRFLPHVAVDLMGCESPPEEILKELIAYSKKMEQKKAAAAASINGQIYGKISVIATKDFFEKCGDLGNLTAVIADDVIEMDEDPLSVVRSKKRSSIGIGIEMIREKKADALVSAGNTGALFAGAKLRLEKLPGIDRPALLILLPTPGRPMAILDVGANVTWSKENLTQFASMGVAYQKTLGVEKPTVGLLNIGTEEKKGTPELRSVYRHLQTIFDGSGDETPSFLGNIEGKNAFRGNIDVLVTDGFTGNVFLKTSEGISLYILELLEQYRSSSAPADFKTFLQMIRSHIHFAEYPGAILSGVEGIIIKCHGDSPPSAMVNGVKGAMQLIERNFLDQIKSQLVADHTAANNS